MINASFECNVVNYDPSDLKNDNDFKIIDKADLVIIDLNTTLDLGNAPDYISQLKKQINDVPLLVMHIYEEKKLTKPILEAGANGYLPITPSETEITLAIKALLAGKIYYRR